MAYASLKHLSTAFFGLNYAGVLYGALTIPNEPDETKRRLFLTTAAKHAVFAGNTYLIHLLKFSVLPFRQLTLANDLAAFLCCFPNYLIVALPALLSVTGMGEPATPSEERKAGDVEEYLKDRPIEEILEDINAGERAKNRQQQAAFHTWYQWYRVDNKPLSQGLDWAAMAILAGSLAYMVVKKRRPM